MENTKSSDAKNRIENASIKLFSEKGFDATRVNEIAETAGVTKALIYYYFKSKEEILDGLVHSLLENATSIAMDFVHSSIIQMIEDGRLDILPDRLRFISEAAVHSFTNSLNLYYERILGFVLKNRAVFRILMLESLKDTKHQDALFQVIDLGINKSDSLIFKTIAEADNDFNYTFDFQIFKSFFSIMPLVNFAVYYDKFKLLSKLSDKELQASFIRSSKTLLSALTKGSDILLSNQA